MAKSQPSAPAANDDRSGVPSANNQVASPPTIDIALLKKADSALTFVEKWSDTLRGRGRVTTDPSGYEQPEVQRLYDIPSFTYIQYRRNGDSRRGAWPVPRAFPELEHVRSHRIYLPQFVSTPSSSESSTVEISFVEDRTLRPPNSPPDSTRGKKTLTLRPDGDSYKIVSEEEFKREEKTSAAIPEPHGINLGVPGTAQYIVVAERPCSRMDRWLCTIPGVLLLIQGTDGKLLFHMTQGLGELAPGAFVDDPDHFYLESLHEGTYNGFSFTRKRDILAIDAGWSDAEVRQRIREWSPIARIALGSEAPIPLWCLPLHHSEPTPKPCFEKKPTL